LGRKALRKESLSLLVSWYSGNMVSGRAEADNNCMEPTLVPQVQSKIPQTVIFAVNPKSGDGTRGNLIEDCTQAISQFGFTPRVETSIEVIRQLAAEELGAGRLRAVVSCGGDGTLALLANELHPDVRFCVLPLGTENIVARHLGYRKSPTVLASAISGGFDAAWDLGVANGRSFLAMLGAGFDAEVVSRVHNNRRGHISYFSYLLPILQVAASYNYPSIKVTCWPADGANPVNLETRWAFIANLAQYALRLEIVPDAKTDDGLLHGVFLGRSGLLSGLMYLWKIRAKRHSRDPSVTSLAGIRFRLESEKAVPYQLDGDPAGALPVDVTVLPRRLRLLVPPRDPTSASS
jgi:diacylglycerol kinase (ATP)